MKEWSEIRIITREEAKILLDALHPYFMQKLQEKTKETLMELKEMNQLYDELKYFVRDVGEKLRRKRSRSISKNY